MATHARHGCPATARRLISTRQAELITLAAVLLLFVFYYMARADSIGTFSPHRGWNVVTLRPLPTGLHYLASAVLLGVMPVLIARAVSRRTLAGLGLGLGRCRLGLAVLVVCLPLALLAGKVGAGSAAMRAVYPLDATIGREDFLPYAGLMFLYYGAWEVLFRGVLLFGLKDRLGEGFANVLQTALSVLAHFGRPMTETFSAIPGGLVMGWSSLRLGSIWYVVLIHWLVGVSVDWYLITGM
jgi:membrane protease YdiL (CAAX protease family)